MSEDHFKTDSMSLFEFSLNSFTEMELQLRNISLHLHKDEPREELVFTEYEMKFMDKGQPIYRLEAVIGSAALAKFRENKLANAQREAEQSEEDTETED